MICPESLCVCVCVFVFVNACVCVTSVCVGGWWGQHVLEQTLRTFCVYTSSNASVPVSHMTRGE